MSRVYICHTVYHVYVSLLKMYKHEKECDIVLVDTIPNVEQLKERLGKEEIFRNTIVIKREEFFAKKYHSYLMNYVNCIRRNKAICEKLAFLNEYTDKYIYNDYTEIGAFFKQNKITYHLMEDGLDVFKQFDVYEDIGHGYWLKKILFAIFKIPYSVGMAKECLDIEINDDTNLKTKIQKPIIVRNRKELERELNDAYKKKIFAVFGLNKVELKGKKVLILTQVLSEILVTKNDREQYTFYENIIKEYAGQYSVYLKPHPRDNIDYSVLEDKYNIVCLKKEIPMEVYAYLPDMQFDYVITYSSTAANVGNIGKKIIRLDERICSNR